VSKIGAAVLAAAVLVSAGAVAVAGQAVDQPESPERSPSVVATTKATLACPQRPRRASTEATIFAVSPVSEDGTAGHAGTVSASVLGSDSSGDLETLDVRGSAFVRPLADTVDPSVIVSAAGPISAGLTATQWSTETGASSAGTAASWCQAGADDWWFTGVSTSVGSTSSIVLTNSTPAIAVADLNFFGPDGPVTAVGERGIALAPQSQQTISLGRFAPGIDALTVNVHATTGRVTAALASELTSGVTPGGTEWLPAADVPATSILIDASFGSADERSLQITNPGDSEALVKVQVVDESGAFTPSGLEDLRVAPGAVVSEDLTDIVDKGAAAVSLSSTVPVTGAVISSVSRPNDFAVSVPSPELGTPAVVPAIPDSDLELAFSSSIRKGSAVEIVGFTADGTSVLIKSLNLTGRRTTTWQPPATSKAAYYVVTVKVDGDLHAIAQYSGKDGITALPVLSGTYTVTRPDVGRLR
jgi:hypothetical protein